MLKLSKTTSPNKQFDHDWVTLNFYTFRGLEENDMKRSSTCYDNFSCFLDDVREAAKSFFFNSSAIKALPHSSLMAVGTSPSEKKRTKKGSFFFNDTAFTLVNL